MWKYLSQDRLWHLFLCFVSESVNLSKCYKSQHKLPNLKKIRVHKIYMHKVYMQKWSNHFFFLFLNVRMWAFEVKKDSGNQVARNNSYIAFSLIKYLSFYGVKGLRFFSSHSRTTHLIKYSWLLPNLCFQSNVNLAVQIFFLNWNCTMFLPCTATVLFTWPWITYSPATQFFYLTSQPR